MSEALTLTLTLTSLPLFPLGTVLYPGGLLPLQIFEVRYLDMIGKCHKTGAPFGVVSLSEGSEVRKPAHATSKNSPPSGDGFAHEAFHDVGTLARIDAFSIPQPGLMRIECTGMQRFRIARREKLKHGLWIADVTQITPDRPIPIPDDLAPVSVALAQLLATLHLRDPTSLSAIVPSSAQLTDSGWVANRWCELLPISPELKQQLMELENPLVRLELVGDILDRTGIAPT